MTEMISAATGLYITLKKLENRGTHIGPNRSWKDHLDSIFRTRLEWGRSNGLLPEKQERIESFLHELESLGSEEELIIWTASTDSDEQGMDEIGGWATSNRIIYWG